MRKLSFVLALFLTLNSFAQSPNWDWSRNSRGLNGRSGVSGNAVATDLWNDIYVAGGFVDSIIIGGDTLFSPSSSVPCLLKYNTLGDLVWSRYATYGNNASAQTVTTDSWGNIFIAGAFRNNLMVIGSDSLVNDSFGYSAFLIKYDSSGNLLWARNSIGDGTNWSISTDVLGNIYTVGGFQSSTINFSGTILVNDTTRGELCVFIVKYDSSGNVIWAKTSNEGIGSFYGVSANEVGGLYVTGRFTSQYIRFDTTVLTNVNPLFLYGDLCLLKYDTSGNFIWARSINGNYVEQCTNVIADGLGSVYLAGSFASDTCNFGHHQLLKDSLGLHTYNLFLTKYDSSGNDIWATSVPSKYTTATSMYLNSSNKPCLTGQYAYAQTIFGLDTFYNYGSFVSQFDTSGNVVWAKGISTRYLTSQSIMIDNHQDIFISGTMQDSVIIGPDTLHGTALYQTDIFLSKLKWPASLNVTNNTKSEPIKAYPIPTNGILNISLGEGSFTALTMYDATGKKVYSKTLDVKTNEFQLNTAGFADGVYIIHALKNDGVNYQKVVIQH